MFLACRLLNVDRLSALSYPTQSHPTCAFSWELPLPKTWSTRGGASRLRSASRSPWPPRFSTPVTAFFDVIALFFGFRIRDETSFSMSTTDPTFFVFSKRTSCVHVLFHRAGGATTYLFLCVVPMRTAWPTRQTTNQRLLEQAQ